MALYGLTRPHAPHAAGPGLGLGQAEWSGARARAALRLSHLIAEPAGLGGGAAAAGGAVGGGGGALGGGAGLGGGAAAVGAAAGGGGEASLLYEHDLCLIARSLPYLQPEAAGPGPGPVAAARTAISRLSALVVRDVLAYAATARPGGPGSAQPAAQTDAGRPDASRRRHGLVSSLAAVYQGVSRGEVGGGEAARLRRATRCGGEPSGCVRR